MPLDEPKTVWDKSKLPSRYVSVGPERDATIRLA